jgi:hydroxylamine reductase (hybrid-cluster protein)
MILAGTRNRRNLPETIVFDRVNDEILNVLADKCNIRQIGNTEEDIKMMMSS